MAAAAAVPGDVDNHVEATNVKVMVRVRPFNKKETLESQKKREQLRSVVKMRDQTCVIVEYTTDDRGFVHETEREAFQFDECFWSVPVEQDVSAVPFADQAYVYKRSGLQALNAAMKGFNVCLFAYGQTGSGKTHSMLGSPEDPGCSPRLVDDLFKQIAEQAVKVPTTKVVVECMFFEIYNEKVRDLFNKRSKEGEYDAPKIRQHPTKGVFVEGLQRKEVTENITTKGLIEKGTKERAMAETKMNAHSSRSHAIFQIRIAQNDALKGTQRVAIINLVDLAGSEKIKKSEAEGDTFVEATNINQSLSTLRKVIDVLIENSAPGKKKKAVAPFRESVLTWVLSDSLGGNSKTQMIATISPHVSNMEDSLGTLRYALRAKAIVCAAKVNEEKSAEMVNAMRDEILKLRQQMASGGTGTMLPEDIQKEIAMRETEVKEMENLVEESRKKAEQAETKLAEVHQQQQELVVQVTEHKRERFATAFRNAFLISKEKKREQVTSQELIDIRNERDTFRSRCEQLEELVRSEQETLGDIKSQHEALDNQLREVQEHSENEITRLSKAVATLSEDKQALIDALNAKERGHELLSKRFREAEEQLKTVHEDVMGMGSRLEAEQAEKLKVKETFESLALTSNAELGEMRVKKEKYKLMATEERTRAAAWKAAATERWENDRAQLLATMRAQQQLLDEKTVLCDMLGRERDAANDRATSLEQRAAALQSEMEVLHEALKSYQESSIKWMQDHAQLERDVARLRMQIDVPHRASASIHPYQASPHSQMRAAMSPLEALSVTPRRAQSPTASAVSPYLRQPAIRPATPGRSPADVPKWRSPR